MARYKTTMFFNQRGRGWSETWFQDYSSVSTLTLADAKSGELMTLRAGLLTPDVQITYRRTSDPAMTGASILVKSGPTEYVGVLSTNAAPASTCLDVTFKDSTQSYRKITFLRGFPANRLKNGGGFDFTGLWTSPFAAWSAFVTNGNWGWMATPHGTPIRRLQTMIQNPDGTVTFTFNGPAVVPPVVGKNYEVTISGLIQPGELNGRLLVQFTGAQEATTARRISIADFVKSGKMNYATTTLQKGVGTFPGNVNERKAGRAFGVPAGKSKAKSRY